MKRVEKSSATGFVAAGKAGSAVFFRVELPAIPYFLGDQFGGSLFSNLYVAGRGDGDW
jgi:hypothetical protein